MTLVKWAAIVERTEDDDFYYGDEIAHAAIESILAQLGTDRKNLSDLLWEARNS